MKKFKFSSNRLTKLLSNKYIKSVLLLLAGLLLGGILFHHPAGKDKKDQLATHEQIGAEHTIWTCAMHPQIRMDKPGLCPICGMDLIPLQKSNVELDDQAIEMSESALKLADVQTSVVGRGNGLKEVRLFGKIQTNEKLLQSQTAHIPGRLEKLYVNVTGESVNKGQMIAKIYSPELISAQKELLEAMKMKEKYPALSEAAHQKLLNWKLTEEQISGIESSGRITTVFEIYATTSGIVTSRRVNEGDYIGKGEVLFDVADLSVVWAVFDAYESDLPWISTGQKVEFTTNTVPGTIFDGLVSFIDPVIDPETRTAKVRADINNARLLLKPESFINGSVNSEKKSNGKQIIIPQSAVLWTGTRSIVYVKIPGTEIPSFKIREITLGASMNDSYVVAEGLKEGEEIVTNGTFSVDAAAQLSGKPSMMSHDDYQIQDMSGMDMKKSLVRTTGMTAVSPKMVLTQVTFNVSGNCEMCKERIEKAALSVKGVYEADWNIKSKIVKINYDSNVTNTSSIHQAIAGAGHDTDKFKADDEVYAALPECCLYRKQ